MTDVEASSFPGLKTEGNGPVSRPDPFPFQGPPGRNLWTVLILDLALKRYGPIKKTTKCLSLNAFSELFDPSWFFWRSFL